MPDQSSPHPSSPEPERLSPKALERRVKRWLLTGPFECYIQVTPGLEPTLVEELLAGGFAASVDELHIERGGVRLELNHDSVMRANLSLRTPSRVLLRLGTFPAASPEMLYDRARKLPWETQLGFADKYQLRITARASNLQAGDAIANPVNSAIARRMRDLGLYPKAVDEAPLEFHVRLLNDYCTISLNTSGEHLHRRGVRRHVHAAPLRETVAAAMVLVGLGEEKPIPDVIIDPFCGSGTLLLEAADQVHGLQPGHNRRFAFEQAAWFRAGGWREVQREAERRLHGVGSPAHEVGSPAHDAEPVHADASRAMPRLLGFDHDPQALNAAKLNLAGEPYDRIELAQADSTRLDFDSFGAKNGLIITNLPYGVRLSDERTAAETMGRFLAQLLASNVRWKVVLLATPAEAEIAKQLIDVEVFIPTRNGGLNVVLVAGTA